MKNGSPSRKSSRSRIGDGIAARREKTREIFKQNFASSIDSLGITQSEVIRRIDAIFARDQVLKDANDPASGTRTVPAWELSRWACGKITPDPIAINAIAEALGIQPTELMPAEAVEDAPKALETSFIQIEGHGYRWSLSGIVSPQVHRRLLEALAA